MLHVEASPVAQIAPRVRNDDGIGDTRLSRSICPASICSTGTAWKPER
jgi:hypothetical protein